MNVIFSKENEVLKKAEDIIKSDSIDTEKDKEIYIELFNEYKSLLKQTERIIRLSDAVQGNLNTLRRNMEEISKIDFLTNVYNRRFFNEIIIKQWSKCKENKKFLAIIMIDIDRFKDYNDKYGHIEGDNCLRTISAEINNIVKNSDSIFARYGGEEFIISMSNTDIDSAKVIAENIRKSIENLNIVHNKSENNNVVTISIGVASNIPNEELSHEKLINIADKALYKAKNSGRNKVCI